MVHYSNCPLCRSVSIKPAFSATDHTVSKEQFSIWKCADCTLLFTQDVPGQDAIGKYYQSENYISHSDTQQGLVNRLYHRVRKITLAGKRKLVKHETGLSSGRVLDVGCGTGAFLHSMNTAGWEITGLEPDAGARGIAKSLYNIEPMPAGKLFGLAPGSFDAITAWHVMEHVHQLHEYIAQLKDLLSKNGRIFIAVPNYTSGDASSYGADWAAYDVPRHLYHFSPQSMQLLMGMHALKVDKMKPMWFDSFYVSMLSEQYRNGKGNLLAASWNGLVSNLKTIFNTARCSSVIYVIRNA